MCLVTWTGHNILALFSTNGKLSNFLNEKCERSFSICCSHSQCLSVCVSSPAVGTAAWLAINTLVLLWPHLALGFSAVKANTEAGHPAEDCCCHGTEGWEQEGAQAKRDKGRKSLSARDNNDLHHCCVRTPGSNSFLQHSTTLQISQVFCFPH